MIPLSVTNLNLIASILFVLSPASVPSSTQFCHPLFDRWTRYCNLYPKKSLNLKLTALIALFCPVVPNTVSDLIFVYSFHPIPSTYTFPLKL